MKTRYRLMCRGRGGKFYCVDSATGKRTSLDTTNEDEAEQIIPLNAAANAAASAVEPELPIEAVSA